MTPSEQHQVDRIWAAVDALKSTAKSLERLHEMDASRAIEYFDRAPPFAAADQSGDKFSRNWGRAQQYNHDLAGKWSR
jgi:hypothetical protein